MHGVPASVMRATVLPAFSVDEFVCAKLTKCASMPAPFGPRRGQGGHDGQAALEGGAANGPLVGLSTAHGARGVLMIQSHVAVDDAVDDVRAAFADLVDRRRLKALRFKATSAVPVVAMIE
jgi:hypothetical protein